ncbi:MAG: mechanosensitive ion channel family protein [Acidobacteria bacterium]|nr:mechanosensitive ion channel family protein [Acidobacteriota bacterium]
MAASEVQKKVLYFFIWAGILALILILFPFLEDWINSFVAGQFGLVVSHEGIITTASGSTPDKMTETWISLVVNVLEVAEIILWMAMVVTVVRFIAYLATKAFYRNAAKGEISSLVTTVLSVIVYIVAFFIIFQSQFPNIQLAPLFTGSTIIGIVVGLALQDTLGNLFAGLALQADQSFQIGDVIAVTGKWTGVVESISWRGVKVRTFQNKLLVVSNSVLGKESIEVAPKDNLNARLVFFSTRYVHSPAKISHLIREAIRLDENVSPKIRPIVRIRDLGADGVDWEVKYWLENYAAYNDSDALVRQRIWYAFQRENIEFAFPTRTLHHERRVEELAPEDVANIIAERLGRVSIFAPLSDEEIERLANVSTTRTYAPGEAIVRQGQEGNSMFVVLRGTVKVQIPEKTYQKTISTLKENDFFGEMSLLTGEPRTANVVAFEETEVMRIDKSGLKPILESNPSLVETIGELVEERRAILAEQSALEAEQKAEEKKKGVVGSLRSFFGLN